MYLSTRMDPLCLNSKSQIYVSNISNALILSYDVQGITPL